MNRVAPWWWMAGFTLTGVLIYLLSPILTPFFLAATFAYLGDPLADILERYKCSRTLAVSIVFLVLSSFALLVVLMMVPLLRDQVSLVATKTPVAVDWLQHVALPYLGELFGLQADVLDIKFIQSKVGEQLQDSGGVITTMLQSIGSSGLALVAWVGNAVLVPVVTFYLLRDWDILTANIANLLPRRNLPVAKKLALECDEVLSAFVRGQLMVMLALGIIYAVGLWIVGLDLALLVGLLAGLASIVPYLGVIIGVLFATVAALIQFGEPQILVWVGLVFIVGQLLEGMVLTPLLVGDKIGLHPVAVIFAILAGGQLFGFMGILMALPVAAVIMVILRHAHDQYLASLFYGEDPPVLDAEAESVNPVDVELEGSSETEAADPSLVERATAQETKAAE